LEGFQSLATGGLELIDWQIALEFEDDEWARKILCLSLVSGKR
jgi:hypothetical protein